MVIFLAAIIHILRPPGLYEYPLTAWYSHRSAEERGRVQLRSLLSGIGPQPEISERWMAQGHTYTEVPPDRVCAFNADDRPLQSIDEMGLSDPKFLRTRTPESREAPETGPSLAFYLNKLWAMRHGYRLTRELGQSIPGRMALWNKMGAIKKMTTDTSCDYIIYMDTDLSPDSAPLTIGFLALGRSSLMLPRSHAPNKALGASRAQ
ncbi:hypothetical protein JCM24511_04797 [Saitozyma sp. JCM 24511]|nr:hypothetical protein JCM24511_04797 [Saitozyma sp. JCM 24511]